MPKKKKKAKTKKMKRKFNLKDGGIPLKAIVKGLDAVIKSGDNTAKAIAVRKKVNDVVKTLSSICDLNRWTTDV